MRPVLAHHWRAGCLTLLFPLLLPMLSSTKKIIAKCWAVLWVLWSIVITSTLIIAICAVLFLEWRSKRALDPDLMTLMPAPTMISEGIVDPFSDAMPLDVKDGLGVFYATDRPPAGPEDDQAYYRNERGDMLRLGVARVQIGDNTKSWEELKAITVSSERDQDYLLRVTQIEEIGSLEESRTPFSESEPDPDATKSAKRYADLINQHLKNSRSKDITIYVHGYKVVFENPLLLATELWHYMGYQGVMIAYAWPSTPNFLAYVSDLETTRYSARHLRQLIDFLSRETDAERIHIIGYSAGTGLVLSTLDELALIHTNDSKETIQAKYRLGNVLLVCSDVDRGIFSNQMANGVWKIPSRLTICVSEADATLEMSQMIFQRRRLGRLFEDDTFSDQVSEFLKQQQHLELIDVSNAENVSANNGHAYFHKSPWVSSDMLLTLATDLPPGERGLVRQEGSPLWTFPDDYPEQLRKLKPKLQEAKGRAAKKSQ